MGVREWNGATWNTLSLEYDAASNVLTAVENGEGRDILTSSFTSFQVEAEVMATSRGGWHVTVNEHSSGFLVSVAFDSTGVVVQVTASESYVGEFSGLCGNFDQQPDNDIVNSHTGAQINRMVSQYATNDKYYPALLKAAESWRVAPEDSAFQSVVVNSGLEHNRFYNPLFVSNATTTYSVCDGLVGWLQEACNFDVQQQGQDAAWQAKYVFDHSCHQYCASGASSMLALQDYSMCRCAAADGLDLHAEYSSEKVPKVELTSRGVTTGFVNVPMGGQYTLRRGLAGQEVRLNVECSGAAPSLSAGASKTVKAPFKGGVHVQLDGSAGIAVPLYWRVSWKPVVWPKKASAPVLKLGATLTPTFKLAVDEDAYGLYTFELAVSDGCEIWKARTNVTYECAACTDASGLRLRSQPLAPSTSGSVRRLHSATTVEGSPAVMDQLGFALSPTVRGRSDLRVVATKSGAPLAEAPMVDSTNPSQTYVIAFANFTIPSETEAKVTDNQLDLPSYTTSVSVTGLTNPPKSSVSPYNTLPYATYPTTGISARTQNSSDVSTTTTTVASYLLPICSVTLARSKSGDIVTATITVEPEASTELASEQCLQAVELVYGTTLPCTPTDRNLTVVNSTVVEPTCGVPPVAVIKCQGSLPKYTNVSTAGSFDSLSLDASLSYSAMNTKTYSRALTYEWTLESKPATAQDTGVLGTASSLTVTPKTKGDYTVKVKVSDGCQSVTETFTFSASCPSTLGVTLPAMSDATSSGAPSTYTITGVTTANEKYDVNYKWTITPPAVTRGMGNQVQALSSSAESPSFVMRWAGTWGVKLVASDNCVTEVKESSVKVVEPDNTNLQAVISLVSASTTLYPGTTIVVNSTKSTADKSAIQHSFWWISKQPSISARPALSAAPGYSSSSVSGDADMVYPGERRQTGTGRMEFTAGYPGEYEVTLMVYNGYKVSTTTATYTVVCPTLTTTDIKLSSPSNETGVAVTASLSGLTGVTQARWWVTNDETGLTVASQTSDAASVTWTPTRPVSHTVRAVARLEGHPSCPVLQASKQVTPSCATSGSAFTIAADGSSSKSVSWSNGKLGSATLNTVVTGAPSDVVVSYKVMSAPAKSTYSVEQKVTSPANDVYAFTWDTLTDNGVTTTKATSRTVQVAAANAPGYVSIDLTSGSKTAACFQPDLPGVYTVVAEASSASNGCHRPSVTFTVTTQCNAKPTVVLSAPSTVQAMSGRAYAEAVFDASGSTDADSDVLTYKFELMPTPTPAPTPTPTPTPSPAPAVVSATTVSRMNPDAGAYLTFESTTDLPSGLKSLNDVQFYEAGKPGKVVGAFQVMAGEQQRLQVTVSDGCNSEVKLFNVTVTSAGGSITTKRVSFNGVGALGAATISLPDSSATDMSASMGALNADGSPATCKAASAAEWTLVSYTPPTPRSGRGGAVQPPSARAAPDSIVSGVQRVEVTNAEDSAKTWSYSAVVGIVLGLIIIVLLIVLIVVVALGQAG